MNAILCKSLILVGIMGAGKTTIGARLARRLNLPFYDSDVEVEKKLGCTCSDVFFYAGEEYFRKVEFEVISNLLKLEPCIIATGGGAFISDNTREVIKNKGTSLWIKAEKKDIKSRVLSNKGLLKNRRPMLQNGNIDTIISDLVDIRYPIYGQADFIIESKFNNIGEAVNYILSQLIQNNIITPIEE
jgi:shikimate kinase